MAERPIFLPGSSRGPLARAVPVAFAWNAGFAAVQKKKNVRALHEAAAQGGWSPLLEVSTKSDDGLGRDLSAFNLRVRLARYGETPLECAFQGSKIFEGGGPYVDIYGLDPRAAKRDGRLRSSGAVVGFRFGGRDFPAVPRTGFYDWLYLHAVLAHPAWLDALEGYAGFTDVEFNPARSINCQARTCATLVALRARGQLEECAGSAERLLELLGADE